MAANLVHSTGHLAVVCGLLTLFVHLSAAQTTAAADEGERVLKRRGDDAWFLEKSVRIHSFPFQISRKLSASAFLAQILFRFRSLFFTFFLLIFLACHEYPRQIASERIHAVLEESNGLKSSGRLRLAEGCRLSLPSETLPRKVCNPELEEASRCKNSAFSYCN